MDIATSLLQLAAFVALGLGLALPTIRRPVLGIVGAAILLSIVHGVTGPTERTLETVHHYAGYEGAALEVSMRAFPTSTFTAPGWQWPLPFVGFGVLWAFVLGRLGTRAPKNPLLLPLLFGWSATATWLAMQSFAAPSAVVQPAGIDRALWPAGLAMALLSARTARGLLQLVMLTSTAVIIARLPAALFSKFASDNRWGTSLDIHRVTEIVNPMTQMEVDPPLAAGSGEQQFWLIWLEHVIIFPALHSMSLFGIALGVYMWHKAGPPEQDEQADGQPA